MLYLVKIRMSGNSGKVRRIFLSTQEESTAFIDAIIKAQGFNSQLEQYEVLREIERTSKTSVVIAKHKILKAKVVIKSQPAEDIENRERQFSISEVDAQRKC